MSYNVAMEKYEKDGPLSYCFGTTLTFELLLRAPNEAVRVFVSPKQKRDETYEKLMALAKLNGVPVIENNEKIFRLSDKDNVMVIGEFKKFERTLDAKKNHVVLVNPSNMGNLGTIFRSCAAFNVGGLAIIRPAADAFDPRAVRSSMGALFSLPFAYFDSFEKYLQIAGERSFYPFMLKEKTSLNMAKKKEPYSLIFGNEATGLDDSFLKVGTPLIIPQSSQVDSLNLDNAVSIALYAFCN
jgi:RNA methyltransferase, TrmH family